MEVLIPMIATRCRMIVLGLHVSVTLPVLATESTGAGITALTLEQLQQQQATLTQRTPTYIDNLIDANVAEDAAPTAGDERAVAKETTEGLRTLNLGLDISHNRNAAGDNATQQTLNLETSLQTRDYGNWMLDAKLSQTQDAHDTTRTTAPQTRATLYQYDYLLTEEWTMDNTVGEVRSFQNGLISQSNNLSLPGHTYVGAASRLTNGKTEIRLMSGEKGELMEARELAQQAHGISVTHGITPQWIVGAQGWQATGDTGDHQELTAVAQHLSQSGATQTKAQVLSNATASGIWLETEHKHKRFQHQAGLYALGDGLTWMGEAMADNTNGAYWRMGYTHPRYNTHTSLDWQQRKAHDAPQEDHQEIRVSHSLNYQHNSATRTGGQLSHSQTDGTTPRTQTHGNLFVAHDWSSGHNGRLQLNLRNYQDTSTTRTTTIDYTHQWLLAAANQLSLQINVQDERESAAERHIYQTGLDWQHQLQNGDSIGANASISSKRQANTPTDNNQNYRLFARKHLNSQWDMDASAQQTQGDTGEPDQSITLSLRYNDSWGKPLGRRDRRNGNIRGVVFFDENNDGRRQPLEKKAANIEVVLDGRNPVQTDQNGEFEFRQVTTGKHQVEVSLGSIPLPWELSTDTDTQVDVGLRDTVTVAIPLSKVHE